MIGGRSRRHRHTFFAGISVRMSLIQLELFVESRSGCSLSLRFFSARYNKSVLLETVRPCVDVEWVGAERAEFPSGEVRSVR